MNNPMGEPPGSKSSRQPTHPRRPPAHQSVSLRHSPPPLVGNPSKPPTFYQPRNTAHSSPNAPASDKANPPSSTSPRVQSNKNSSGESSDAGKWFENTNNNAEQSNASFADNEPPFFLRNSSSGDTPPDGPGQNDHWRRHPSMLPHRPSGLNLGTDGSSTEDFRSVIDDLTVANKRLKQKLRKYEKLYDAHLQDEKLFEVRFHGLPDHKKKELEETLRKFTAELDDSPNNDYPPIAYHPAPFDPQKTASSHTSRFAESGYASLSASGQNSVSMPSNQITTQEHDRQRLTKSPYSRQQQSIQSYLHDIPAGLLPKNHAPMTEKSKKKLVVRRLEQIFAGKRSAPGSHPQPMQQEEVAQSAAMADRRAKEAGGQRLRSEGKREARIMPGRTDDEDITTHGDADLLQRSRPHLSVAEQDITGSGSPNQRPTRPLDLDPYRAQVPAENMEYIRHLGFTPPDMNTEEAFEIGHGWLYFNLVVNMAQLHTLNVTPDFVKEAVSEYSSMFELSHDGRKIRWKGGHDVTRNSSETSSEHPSMYSPYDTLTGGKGKSPTNRLKTGASGSSESNVDPDTRAKRIARAQKEKEQNKFTYTPIFFHKEDSAEDDDFYGFEMGSSSNSPFQNQQAGDSSGFGSSAMRSSSSRKRRDDGPMIFYSKAKFCTDLTGDRRGLSSHHPGSYKSISTHPIGAQDVSQSQSSSVQPASDFGEPRGALDAGPMDIDAKDGARTSSGEEDFGFSPEALRNDTGTESPSTVEFEASGLGGVQPDDNFAINVRRVHKQTAPLDASSRRKSQLYPKKILEALNEGDSSDNDVPSPPHQQSVIKEEILSASRKSLPSSTLPPASFLPFDSMSSGDVDSDLESDVSSRPSTTSSSDNEPANAPRAFNISPVHAGNSDDGSDNDADADEGSDSDDSIDLLATARQMDPTAVQAFEREYDATLADRLAQEIPAGSSAATAGGGSGFNSPARSGVEDADRQSQMSRMHRQSTTSGSVSSRTRNLKRSRTRESLPAALQGTKGQKSQKFGN